MITLAAAAVLAQAFGQPFWETEWGQRLAFVGEVAFYVAALAGGVAGAMKLYGWARRGQEWGREQLRERQRVDDILDDLTAGEWPNGATTLKESHHALYDKAAWLEQAVAALATAQGVKLPPPPSAGVPAAWTSRTSTFE
jgi:hypothetical protein